MSKKKTGRESLPFALLAAIAKVRKVLGIDRGADRETIKVIREDWRQEGKGNKRYIERIQKFNQPARLSSESLRRNGVAAQHVVVT